MAAVPSAHARHVNRSCTRAKPLAPVHERFTWRACAEGTAAIYEQMLQG